MPASNSEEVDESLKSPLKPASSFFRVEVKKSVFKRRFSE